MIVKYITLVRFNSLFTPTKYTSKVFFIYSEDVKIEDCATKQTSDLLSHTKSKLTSRPDSPIQALPDYLHVEFPTAETGAVPKNVQKSEHLNANSKIISGASENEPFTLEAATGVLIFQLIF